MHVVSSMACLLLSARVLGNASRPHSGWMKEVHGCMQGVNSSEHAPSEHTQTHTHNTHTHIYTHTHTHHVHINKCTYAMAHRNSRAAVVTLLKRRDRVSLSPFFKSLGQLVIIGKDFLPIGAYTCKLQSVKSCPSPVDG